MTEKENGMLKYQSIFYGGDTEHYQRWINQIKKYVEEENGG